MRQALILLALAAVLPEARAAGVIPPERLTAGTADQLLGQLSSDGEYLYFASTEHATSQIFVQDRRSGAARPLFDEGADATWPRLSLGGDRLLYIAHAGDAAGDLCVRDLRQGGAAGPARCLADRDHADLQAAWLPGGDVLLLSREGLHGDLVLRRVSIDSAGLRAAPLLRQNLASPAVSPDGRWLAYVPIERVERSVGVSFAAQAARELRLQRLGPQGPEGPSLQLRPRLPGATGQPAFSPDGRHLYFTQYLNDTNLDGHTDGNDHGVLFRVPFDGGKAAPVPRAAEDAPQQLSSAAWNCQYPAPAKARLIATCAFHGSLDVYALPPEGSVPRDATAAQLREELRASQDRWERLLLLGALLGMEGQKPHLLFDVLRLHLGLREHESAAFYARGLASLDGAAQEIRMMGSILLDLVEHRREERALDRGQISARFLAQAEERLKSLAARRAGAAADVQALAWLAQSEILDTIGREGEALAALRAVRPSAVREPMVLHLYGERAREQLRPLGDRRELLAALGALAAHPALPAAERLGYGAALIRELSRGRGRAEVRAEVERQRAQVDAASDLAFLLELEGWLLQLEPGAEERVRAGVFALYRRHGDPDRRRALIAATVGRAASEDSEMLTYQFATTWVSGLPRSTAERRYAEQLYRQVVMERAYVQWAEARTSDARGNFFGVTLQTDSLEGHIGFIEARLREGKTDVEEQYRRRFEGRERDPVLLFVRAYLLARALPEEGLERIAQEATALLREASSQLAQRVELQHLWGYLAHRRYLRGGDAAAAQEASVHYRLGLDLARDNVRYRAALLGQLGLLQAAVGNHRAALSFLEERDKLPFTEPQARLSHLLALARSRFHVGRAGEGAAAAEQALALVASDPGLARFRPLALDRAALYRLAAGEFEKSLAHYDALAPLRAAAPPRDRFALRTARAAAALGAGKPQRALDDLAEAERLLRDSGEAPRRPPQRLDDTRADLRLLVLGLRAQAQRALGQDAQAERALLQRRAGLLDRRRRRALDEDLLELARTEASLAGIRARRSDLQGALRHAEEGLRHADAFGAATGTPVLDEGLALLQAAADLRLFGRAGPAAALEPRLREAHRALGRLRSPRWAAARARIGVYLTLLRL